jgi:hypothetical protein
MDTQVAPMNTDIAMLKRLWPVIDVYGRVAQVTRRMESEASVKASCAKPLSA